MFRWSAVPLTIAACALAAPVAAQNPAPTTTAFDGTYLGISNTLEETQDGKTWTRQCFHLDFGPPATLTIVNGIARTGKTEGSVSPQGFLVMRSFWSHFDGRIDSQGTARARADRGMQLPASLAKDAPADDAVRRGLCRGIERIKRREPPMSGERRPGYSDH